MVTQKLTREVVEQGIEHFDDNDWRVAESAPEFKDFAENFFAMGFQDKANMRRASDRSRRTSSAVRPRPPWRGLRQKGERRENGSLEMCLPVVADNM